MSTSTPDGKGRSRAQGKLRDRYGPQIRFGLGAVRGVGEAALESIFEARESGGPFRDLFDLAGRVDARRLNRGVVEALVQCGAFDSALAHIGVDRARAFAAVDRALERAKSASRDRACGQTTLFGMLGGEGAEASGQVYPTCETWDQVERLRREKAALGCYVTGHPLHRYGTGFARLGATLTVEVSQQKPWGTVGVVGMVEGYREKIFRSSGAKVAFFEVEDLEGRVFAKLRGDRIEHFGPLLRAGTPVFVTGKVSFPINDDPAAEQEPTLLVDAVEPLAESVLKRAHRLTIGVSADSTDPKLLSQLATLLAQRPGPCPVELKVALPDQGEAILALKRSRVELSDDLLSALERMFGASVAELH